MDARKAFVDERSVFNSDGEIIKIFECWTFFHRDKEILTGFVNSVLREGLNKLFKLNKLEIPADFKIPDLESVFDDLVDFNDKTDLIKLYFDSDICVIYRERNKKYETYTQQIKQKPKRGRIAEIVTKFFPETASPRAYSKKSLRKMALKSFNTCAVMVAIIFASAYINIELLEHENYVLLGIAFVLSLFTVAFLVIGIYYLFLGIFGRKKFIKVGV